MTEPRIALTVQQQRTLDRMCRAPLKWLVSDRRYFATEDRFRRDNQRAYFATLNRVSFYNGPDYRVRFQGQGSFIRATQLQYEQAGVLGLERRVGDGSNVLQIAA